MNQLPTTPNPTQDGGPATPQPNAAPAPVQQQPAPQGNSTPVTPPQPAGAAPNVASPAVEDLAKAKADAEFWKQKFQNSAAGAQQLYGRVKKFEQTLAPEPTEPELAAMYPGWEDMSDFEKRLAKDTAHAKRQAQQNADAFHSFISSQGREGELATLTMSNPVLAKYEPEFREFVDKPENAGVSPEILANAFLYKIGQAEPPAPSAPAAPTAPINGMEPGNAGAPPPPSTSANAEELARLQQDDPEAFAKLIKQRAVAGRR